jgi:hypothetical protein
MPPSAALAVPADAANWLFTESCTAESAIIGGGGENEGADCGFAALGDASGDGSDFGSDLSANTAIRDPWRSC